VVIIGLFDLLQTIKVSLQDPAWSGYGVEAYLFAALVYFAFCFAMSLYSRRLERADCTAARRPWSCRSRRALAILEVDGAAGVLDHARSNPAGARIERSPRDAEVSGKSAQENLLNPLSFRYPLRPVVFSGPPREKAE